MKQISGKDFRKLLESREWTLRRVSGSHHIFVKERKRERIVVPVHGNKPLKLGLLRISTTKETKGRERMGFQTSDLFRVF